MMKNIIKMIGVFSLAFVVFSSCELEEDIGQAVLLDTFEEDGGCSAFDSTIIVSNGAEISAIATLLQQADGLLRPVIHVASDEVTVPQQPQGNWINGGQWIAYHTHAFQASDGNATTSYQNLASAIFTSGRNAGALEIVGDAALGAEARVVEAYTKWLMLDIWGLVQYQTLGYECDLNEDPNFLFGQEAIDNILADLEKESVLNNLPSENYGNPNLATAYALLARIYLNKFIYVGDDAPSSSDLEKVIEYTDLVEAEGYRLSDAGAGEEWFTTNFGLANENSPEHIWVFANEPGASIGGLMGALTRSSMGWLQGGWNGYALVEDFYNKFDHEDPRFSAPATEQMHIQYDGDGNLLPEAETAAYTFGVLVGEQLSMTNEVLKTQQGTPLDFTEDIPTISDGSVATEASGPRFIKFEPNNESTVDPGVDFPVFRYADVHLMRAEAMWRMGDEAGAILEINELRSSRGYAEEITSIDANGQEILDERGFELWNELFRRTDQIRFGTFQEAWANKDAEASSESNVFPIPTAILAQFPQLEQNEGRQF